MAFQVESTSQNAALNEIYLMGRYARSQETKDTAEGLLRKLRPLSEKECMDVIRDVQQNYRLPGKARTIGEMLAEARQRSGAQAKLLLQALAMMPDTALSGDNIAADYNLDHFWVNNTEAERSLFRGGNWNTGAGAGVFSSDLNSPRSHSSGGVGGRVAFVKLPTE